MTYPTVAVRRAGYAQAKTAIEQVLDAVGYQPQKKAFLIKPNMVDAVSPSSAVVTHPDFVGALIDVLLTRYRGAEIVVGDGAAVHADYDQLLRATGYAALHKRYPISVVDLHAVPRRAHQWQFGTLSLPSMLDTHEYINVPKLKTHLQTQVSLGAKNQKGLLSIQDKKRFHRTLELQPSIAALTDVVQPAVTLYDGILGLEGNGPLITGTPKKVGLVLGSKDMPAGDAVAAKIMGFDPAEIPSLQPCEGYEVDGAPLASLIRPFVRPCVPIRQYNVYGHIDASMCSMCAVNSVTALTPSFKNARFMAKLALNGALFARIDLLFGKPTESPQAMGENVLCIGNCARTLAKEHQWALIEGCPPSQQQMQEGLLKFLRDKKKRR